MFSPPVARCFCLAEDRPGAEIGIQIAILSLLHHSGPIPVRLFRPGCTAEFSAWLSQYPHVSVQTEPLPGASSWNCKPHALLTVLREGAQEAIWFDSDMMAARDCRPLFDECSPDTIAITQEAKSMDFQGTRRRTEAWGFPVGRELPYTLNSSIVRTTAAHIPFLEAWKNALSDPAYVAVANAPLDQRPLHLMGDQDVFNALIGHRDFASIPLRIIRSGQEIIHCGGALGYSVGERLTSLTERPYFFHAIAGKPWVLLVPEHSQPGWFGWYRRLLQECSPYVLECRRHPEWFSQREVWLEYGTFLGRILGWLGGQHYALVGLLPAAAAAVMDRFRKTS